MTSGGTTKLIQDTTTNSPATQHSVSWITTRPSYTDNKSNQIFSIYKEIQSGSSCKVIYEEGLPNIWGNAQIFPHIWGGRYSYMTLQLLHFEFPYIWGKFYFLLSVLPRLTDLQHAVIVVWTTLTVTSTPHAHPCKIITGLSYINSCCSGLYKVTHRSAIAPQICILTTLQQRNDLVP